MRSLVLLALGVVLVTRSASAQDGPVEVKSGFHTGNSYRALSVAERASYGSGIIDGLLMAPVFGAPKGRMQWLERCISGMSNEQVAAIFTRYNERHPEGWDEHMQFIAYRALLEACAARTGSPSGPRPSGS
jgi:hypothetical protein